MKERVLQITEGQEIFLYITLIIISIILLISSVILLIVYFKRPKWNLQMTMTTLITFFSLLHCIVTSIPMHSEGLLCDISASLHETSLMSMGLYTNYFFLYAYLSFEKPH